MRVFMSKRIMIARLPNALGDIVMALPALDLLHQEGLLGEVLGPGFARSLLAGLPYKIEMVAEGLHEVAQYRVSDCAYGFLMRSSFTTALRMRRGGLKQVGYRRHFRRFLLWRSMRHDMSWQKVYEYYRLAQFAVAMLNDREEPREYDQPPHLHLPLTEEQRHSAQEALESAGVRSPYSVVCPVVGAGKNPSHKIYQEFPKLMEHLLKSGEPVISCPGPGQEEECRRLAPGSLELVVDLVAYAGVLAGARRVIAADTGPLHLAAALGVPCVGIYGDTSPVRYSPWAVHGAHIGEMGRWPSVDEVLKTIDGLEQFQSGQKESVL